MSTITFPADLQKETSDQPSPRVKKAPRKSSTVFAYGSGGTARGVQIHFDPQRAGRKDPRVDLSPPRPVALVAVARM